VTESLQLGLGELVDRIDDLADLVLVACATADGQRNGFVAVSISGLPQLSQNEASPRYSRLRLRIDRSIDAQVVQRTSGKVQKIHPCRLLTPLA
jgi:hypothetical protein